MAATHLFSYLNVGAEVAPDNVSVRTNVGKFSFVRDAALLLLCSALYRIPAHPAKKGEKNSGMGKRKRGTECFNVKEMESE